MKWISNLTGRYRYRIHFATILVLSLALIVGGEAVTPTVSAAVTRVLYYPFFRIKSTVMELSAVSRENQRLQLALVEAGRELSLLEEADRENLRLRAVLGFTPPAGYALLPAKVIAVFGEGLPVAAVINRGANEAVWVDQALINEQGLIGRVTSVSPTTATVQLLTDPAHRIAVRVAETRETGIVKYRAARGLILDNFPIHAAIQVGDQILSSGLGGIYPAGLLVGTVESVERPADQPFCRVKLTPAANFNSLEELFILKPNSL
jgi:rod shape-determining protein MreC